MSGFRNLIVEFGLSLAISGWALLSWFIITAWLRGTWEVTLNFNHFGEGPFELFLFPALVILAILANWYYQRPRDPNLKYNRRLGRA